MADLIDKDSSDLTRIVGSDITGAETNFLNVDVSGAVTANIGTTNGLALDATLTGGTAKAILRTAAKGTTVAADTTSTPVDANTQALDVSVKGNVPVTLASTTITGSVAVTGPLTDAQLRLTPVPISGTVSTGLSQPITDTQIRATALPVSLTSTTITNTVAVTGPLTDTELRASAVPISGTVTANATLAVETTKVIGTVNVAAGQVNKSSQANITAVSQAVQVDGSGLNTAIVKISGTFVGTLLFEGQLPDLTYTPISSIIISGVPPFTTVTQGSASPATYQLFLNAYILVRIRSSEWTSGSALVQIAASNTNSHQLVYQGGPFDVTSNIGTTGGLALAATQTDGTQRGQIFDVQTNQTALITNLRHLISGNVTRIFGDSFADGIGAGEEDAGAFPPTATVTGSATGVAVNGQLTMTTGATTGSTGSLQSISNLPFVTGSVANSQNGMTFPGAFLTAFRVVSRRAGVDTVVESSAFNVVPTAITNSGLSNAAAGTLVNGVLHRCDIFYQGNSAIFAIDGVVVHRMSSQIAAPRTDSLDLPTFFEWSNTATPTAILRAGQYNVNNGYFFECRYNVANVTMTCRGSSSNRLGPAPRVSKTLQGFDTARTRVVIKFEATAPATADTLLSIIKQIAGVDAAGATSIGVTTNKVLRITGGQVSCRANAAAAAWSTVTLRSNPAGATVIGSPSWGRYNTEFTSAVANDSRFTFFNFGEAQEFSGTQTLGISLASQATSNIISIVLYGYEYNIGN